MSRRNINSLTELGNERRALVARLAEVESQIDKNLAKTYLEGWTWEELREASSLSQGVLGNRLKKLGLSKGSDVDTPTTRRRPDGTRPENTPEVVMQMSAQRQQALCVDDLGGGAPGRFGGLLSWIPSTPR